MKQLKIYILTFLFPFLGWAQWNQIGQNIYGDAAGDRFGVEVSINNDGTVIAIGAFDNDVNGSNAGQVKIFKNIAGSWTQMGGDLYGDNAGDGFGRGLSLNDTGNIIAIGAGSGDGTNGVNTGHTKVYEFVNDMWTQIGQTIPGQASNDDFGFQLSINNSGTIVAVGARFHDENSFSEGNVRVFENINGTWTQIGQDINGTIFNGKLGSRISLSGNGTIMAASAISVNQSRGYVKVFQNNNGTWTQIGQDINGESASDLFGQGLALSSDGSTVAIGSKFNDNNGTNTGHVKVFKNVNGSWVQVGQELSGANPDDQYGSDVSLSDDGSVLAVSAGGNGFNSLNVGYCIVYRLENNSWVQVSSIINNYLNGDLSNNVELSANGSTIVIGTPSDDSDGQSDAGIARVFGNALLSVEENSFASEITIYPNPVAQSSTISLGKRYTDVSMQVLHMNGQEVMSTTYANIENIKIDAAHFSSGIYIINLVSNQEKATIKMVKR